MLAVNKYSAEYIDTCEAQLEAQLAAYKILVAVTSGSSPKARAALDAFEPLFFNNLVLALDAYFTHRTRAVEGKDGNPLNEVRMICASIQRHEAILTADKTIKYRPDSSVLKLPLGARIHLDDRQFEALQKAFFAELRRRFV